MGTLDELWKHVEEHAREQIPTTCVLGTIGWDDVDEHFDLGTDENDGHTFVRVQLFAGRDHTRQNDDASVGHGHRLLCVLADHVQMFGPPHDDASVGHGHRLLCVLADHVQMFGPPRKGDRCYVLLPSGIEETPGAAVVVAIVSRAPTTQYGPDRGKIDLGPDRDFVVKARSVTLTTHNNQQISISPEGGVQLFDEEGGGLQFKGGAAYAVATKYSFVVQSDGAVKAVLKMTRDEVSILGGSGNLLKMRAGQTTVGTGKFVADATIVALGKGAGATNFAAIGPPTTTTPPVPIYSTSVWIAP